MPPKSLQIRNSTAEFLIFTKQAGENGIEVRIQDGTIWLNQKLMAVLFECSADNISLHLKNIFAEGEMDEFSVTEYSSVTVAYDNISKLYKLNDFIVWFVVKKPLDNIFTFV